MSNPRILVIDDEPNLSRLVRLILERTERFDVLVENRSIAAMTTARAFRPDMILLDVDMPGKDGGQVAREFGADPHLCGVPIVFFTSLISRAEAGEGAVDRGGKLYLAKPVDPRVLIATLDRLLGTPADAA